MATAKANVLEIPNHAAAVKPVSRVVMTAGSKGGTGKSCFSSGLVEWYAQQGIPHTVLDLDTENKSKGSLAAYYPSARKVNVHTSEGLDAFVDALDEGAPIVIADMGAGSGAVTVNWFDSMFDQVAETGVAFTVIGMVTPDPASVEGILAWGRALQHRVQWLIVRNSMTDPADFTYWEKSAAAIDFRRVFQPREISMEYRLAKVENPARQHAVTLGKVASRETDVPALQQTTVVMRAQAYRRNLFAQLDGVKDLLTL
jgi:MinD-like ATPase involved in chromosome partitioning or flagellar assembly